MKQRSHNAHFNRIKNLHVSAMEQGFLEDGLLQGTWHVLTVFRAFFIDTKFLLASVASETTTDWTDSTGNFCPPDPSLAMQQSCRFPVAGPRLATVSAVHSHHSLVLQPCFFCFHVDIYVHCHKPAALAALFFTPSSFFMLHIQSLLNGHMQHEIHAQKACSQPCNEPQPSMTGEEVG